MAGRGGACTSMVWVEGSVYTWKGGGREGKHREGDRGQTPLVRVEGGGSYPHGVCRGFGVEEVFGEGVLVTDEVEVGRGGPGE